MHELNPAAQVLWRVVTSSQAQTRSGAGPTDAALVIAARAGEAWAQEVLFTRYSRMVLGLAQRILAGRDDADDLAQDAFVDALTRLDTLQNPQAFASWLSSIVVRTAAKRLRRYRLMLRLGLGRNEEFVPENIISPNAPPEIRSELLAVYAVVSRLPAEQRVALILRRVEGMELADIAEQMDLSLATVKRRLAAAEQRIQQFKERR